MEVGSINYSNLGVAPAWYSCHDCGANNIKLWRESNTFLDHQSLHCADCLEKADRGKLDFYESDCISWYVPAVPTDDGSFWGYTSVPQEGCDWWHSLQTTKSAKKFNSGDPLPTDYYCHYCGQSNRRLWVQCDTCGPAILEEKKKEILICVTCIWNVFLLNLRNIVPITIKKPAISKYVEGKPQFISAIPIEIYDNRQTAFQRNLNKLSEDQIKWYESFLY